MSVKINPFKEHNTADFFSYSEKKFPEYAEKGHYRGGTGLQFSDILIEASPGVRWMCHGEKLGDSGVSVSYGRDDKGRYYISYLEYGIWSPYTEIKQYITLDSTLKIFEEIKLNTYRVDTLEELIEIALTNLQEPESGIELEIYKSTHKNNRDLEWYALFKSLNKQFGNALTEKTKNYLVSSKLVEKLFNPFICERINNLGEVYVVLIELLTIFPKVNFGGIENYPTWLYSYNLRKPLEELTANILKEDKALVLGDLEDITERFFSEKMICEVMQEILSELGDSVRAIATQNESDYFIEVDNSKSVNELAVRKYVWEKLNLGKVKPRYSSVNVEIKEIKDVQYPKIIVSRERAEGYLRSLTDSSIWYTAGIDLNRRFKR